MMKRCLLTKEALRGFTGDQVQSLVDAICGTNEEEIDMNRPDTTTTLQDVPDDHLVKVNEYMDHLEASNTNLMIEIEVLSDDKYTDQLEQENTNLKLEEHYAGRLEIRVRELEQQLKVLKEDTDPRIKIGDTND